MSVTTRQNAPTTIERTLLESHAASAYQIVREIGRGGMGIVFLARDVMLHRVVAIKVLRQEIAGADEQRERFRREARVTARLNHEGIVAVHAFGETDDLVYIVMEYVNGRSLSSVISALPEHRMEPAHVRAILASLATTLDHAHASGIVHRDLKPENVLIARDTGQPKLTDFGVALSRSLDPLPSEIARAFGTPHFMSPEQAASEPDLDGRSDIYSLGVLGYLMLTGKVPFDGSRFEEIAAKHVADSHVPVRDAAPWVPRDLASAVDRCLAKDRERRWQRGRDLATELVSCTNRHNAVRLVNWASRVAALVGVAASAPR